MGLYRHWIEELECEWEGKKVIYKGKKYTVVGVDYNGGLLIDKRNRYNSTTAVPVYAVTEVKP